MNTWTSKSGGEHTYTAYSAATCQTANKLASVTFRTPSPSNWGGTSPEYWTRGAKIRRITTKELEANPSRVAYLIGIDGTINAINTDCKEDEFYIADGNGDLNDRAQLAGAQQKIVLYRTDRDTWALPVGGHPSSHILKPRSPHFERLVENEHYCMTLARRCGMDAARTHIERLNDLPVLVIDRYDRLRAQGGGLARIHQEDLAQALGETRKYESEGGPTARRLFSVPGVKRDALFERIMFNWFIGNGDAHAKNYSVLEPGTPRARLAPAYDILSTECYESLPNTLATAMGGAHTLNEVDGDQVEAFGRDIGYRPGEARKRLHELAERVRDGVRSLAEEDITPGPVRTEAIEARTEEARSWGRD